MSINTKLDFSKRLNQAAEEYGDPLRGRRAKIARRVGVSGQAVRKWLNGESIPSMWHLSELSAFYRVSAQWLLTGTGPKTVAEMESSMESNQLPSLADFSTWIRQADQVSLGEATAQLEAMASICRHEMALRAWRHDPLTFRRQVEEATHD